MRTIVLLFLTTLACFSQGFSDSSAPFLLSTSSLRKGLVGYWRLEEASGTRYDCSQYGNHLSASNSPGNATGLVNYCGSFNNTNLQYLSIADNSSLRAGGTSVVVSCWAKFVNFATPSNLGIASKQLVTKYGDTANGEYALLYDASSQRISFYVTTNGSSGSHAAATTFGAVFTNIWYHCMGWWDAPNQKAYVAVNLVSNSVSIPNPIFSGGNAQFQIGNRLQSSTNESMSGWIDEVGVWKGRLLTDAEKLQLYNFGKGTHFPWSHP